MAPQQGTTRAMRRLRKAVLRGDIKEVQRQLVPSTSSSTWASWVASKQGPPDINHIFDDDGGASIAHCLAAGKELARSSSGSSPSSLWWPDSGAAGTDAERAALLCWLLDRGYKLDFSLVNVRCQNVLHCCLLNGGSLHVLRTLLFGLPSGYPPQLRYSLSVEDCEGLQPLELAVHKQQWPAVALLLAAGAHASNPATRAARSTVTGLLPGVAPSLATQLHSAPLVLQVLSRLPFGIGSLVGAVFGNADPRMQKELAAAAAGASGPSSSSAVQQSAGSGVASMELEAVAAHMRAAAQQVAYVVGVDEAAAMALLAANSYDVDKAIEAGFSRAAAAKQQQGASTSAAGNCAAAPGASVPRKCLVCYEDEAQQASPASAVFSCGHFTCDECCRGILKAALDEGTPHRAACPAEGCLALLPLDSAQKLLDIQAFSRYQQLLTQHYVDANPNLKWCPRAGCGRSVHLDAKPGGADGIWEALQAGRPVDVMCKCGHTFCWACLEAAHEPVLCAQMSAWRQLTREMQQLADSDTAQWVMRNTKPCPQCKARIQKHGGCLHMTCKVCNKQWCWVCGQDWTKHSSATGGYYQCTMDQSDAAAAAAEDDNDSTGAATPQPAASSTGNVEEANSAGLSRKGLISGIFGAVRSAALQHKRQHYLMQQSSHACDPQRLLVLLRHMQQLLGAMLQAVQESDQRQQQQEKQGTQHSHGTASTGSADHIQAEAAGCCLPSGRQRPPVADQPAGMTIVAQQAAVAAPRSVGAATQSGVADAAPRHTSDTAAGKGDADISTPVGLQLLAGCGSGNVYLSPSASLDEKSETAMAMAAEVVPAADAAAAMLPSATITAGVPAAPRPIQFNSLASSAAVQQTPVAEDAATSGLQQRLQDQGLQPLEEQLLTDWQRAVEAGSEALCNSCVLGFFTSNISARRYLEHMQARLASATHQLLAAAEQLPHAQKVVDQAADTGRGQTASAVVAATFSALGWLWRRLGYTSSNSSSASSSGSSMASVRFDLEGQDLVQQVAYCIAVTEQQEQLRQLVAEVWHWRGCLLHAARMGALADVNGTAAEAGAAAGLTALDVVSVAASSRDAAWGMVAQGAQRLWDFMATPPQQR